MGLGKFGKLFFDEVEEENQTGSVSEKNTQTVAPNVSAQPTVQQPNVSTTPDAPHQGQLSEQCETVKKVLDELYNAKTVSDNSNK